MMRICIRWMYYIRDALAPMRDESVGFDDAQHVFIEGENLAVLKVLQKAYFGKVKMIYIDPPYNTGNDHFIYPDRFAMSKKDYQKRVGDVDAAGHLIGPAGPRARTPDARHGVTAAAFQNQNAYRALQPGLGVD